MNGFFAMIVTSMLLVVWGLLADASESVSIASIDWASLTKDLSFAALAWYLIVKVLPALADKHDKQTKEIADSFQSEIASTRLQNQQMQQAYFETAQRQRDEFMQRSLEQQRLHIETEKANMQTIADFSQVAAELTEKRRAE